MERAYAAVPYKDGAKTQNPAKFQQGQMVMVKRTQAGHHFSTKAVGPYWVLEQKGDQVVLRGINGRETVQHASNCKAVLTAQEL